MTNNAIERRAYPRLNKNLPLKIKLDQFELATQTQNISCSGIYCKVKQQIPLMTKLKIMLFLPIKLKNNKETIKEISCQGVIVRIEPDTNGAYNTAIFFNQISNPAKEKIAQYVNSHLVQ